MRPATTDYPEYYETYIGKIQEENVMNAFSNQQSRLEEFLNSITEEKACYRYADDKWTIKEVMLHVADAERIFAYRALCIARGERNSLNSFDQNEYNMHSKANERSWESIKNELMHIRRSTIDLFDTMDSSTLATRGIINGNTITPASLGYIIAGHSIHHIQVINERYLR